jgi:hypothetical protein
MVWGGGTVGVPSGLAVDCTGSHARCVVARLYRGMGRALVPTWVPVLGSVESAMTVWSCGVLGGSGVQLRSP